jgi:hydroxypyruvate isomerase
MPRFPANISTPFTEFDFEGRFRAAASALRPALRGVQPG